MISRTVKSIASAGIMAGALIAIAPHAFASSHAPAADTDDNISPASKPVTANLKTGTKFTATGSINGIAITVTCTTTTFKGTTPAHGLGPVVIAPPTFKGCTDSLHGTDTVTTNHNSGNWTLTFVDGANDETKDSTADQLVITVPKGGATFSSNILSSCKVIVAPTAPAKLASKYNDAGTAVATADALPVAGQGCSASSPTHVSETLTLSPVIKDVG